MKTSSAKSKGRSLQKWVRDTLLKLNPSLTQDDVRSTAMGQSGVDIQLSSAAKQSIPYSIECKNLARIAVYSLYDQAKANAGELTPILVIKQNRSNPLVVVDAEWFFKNNNK
jgi:hypothetical protein